MLRLLLLPLLLLPAPAIRALEVQATPLKVGFDQNYPPYEYVDDHGRPAGFNIDLIRAAAEESGLAIDLRPGPWADIRAAFERGELDVLTGMFATEERSRRFLFSVPHSIVSYAIFTRTGADGPQRESELTGRRILVEQGDLSWEYLRSRGLDVVGTPNPEAALRVLRAGQGDCAVICRSTGLFLLQREGWTGVERTPSSFLPQKYCFAVRKDRPDLLSALNEALFVLKESGRFGELSNRHFGPLEPRRQEWWQALRPALLVFVPVLVLLLAVSAWTWTLRRLVARRTRELRHELQERLRAEEALSSSRGMLQQVLDTVPQSVFWKDRDGTFLGCNQAFSRAAGLHGPTDILGLNDRDMPWGPTLADAYQSDDRQVVETGRPKRHFLEPFLDSEGRRLWVDTTKVPLEDGKGQVIGVLGLFEDVTERKLAEEAYIESEQRLNDIVDFLPDATFAIDRDGKVILWNHAMEEMTGIVATEMLQKGDHEYALPFYGVRRPILVDLALRNEGDANPAYDYVKRTGDVLLAETETVVQGRPCALWGVARPLFDTKGKVIGAIESIRDITEQRRAEEVVRQSNEKLATIFQASPDSIVIFRSRDLVLMDGNSRFESLMGRPLREMVGQRFDSLGLHVDPAWVRGFVEAVQSGGPQESREATFTFPDGRRRLALVSGQGILIQGEPCILTLARDITAWKAVQEEAAAARQRLALLVEQTPIPVIEWSLDFHVVSWNRAAERTLGYTREEALGRSGVDLIIPEPVEPGFAGRWQARVLEGVQHESRPTRRKDGTIIESEWFNALLVDKEGRSIGVASLCQDVTEQQRAKEALRASEEKFRSVVECSPWGMHFYRLEADGRMILTGANPASDQILGIAHRPKIGLAYEAAFPDLQTPEVLATFRRVARAETGGQSFQLSYHGDNPIPSTYDVHVFRTGPDTIVVAFADITERKRSELAIQDSERRLRTIFEGAPIGMFRSSPEGHIVEVNPALAAMFCYEDPLTMRAEVNLQGLAAALYGSAELRSQMVQRLKENLGTWCVEEVHFLRRDGTFMDGIESIILQPDPGTGSLTLFGFIQDITNRKQAEDALRSKTAMLEAQMNATLDGILVIADGTKRSLINQRIIDLFQVPQAIVDVEDDAPLLEHVMGLTKDPDAFLAKVRHLYTHQEETSRDEIEFKSGMILERYSAPVLGEGGKNYGRIWTFHDITERKRAEQEIQALQQDLANIIDSMPSMLVGLDEQGTVTQWNRQAEASTGIPASRALGRPLEDLMPEFSPWIEALQADVNARRQPAAMEHALLEKDGTQCYYNVMMYPLLASGMQGAVLRIEDVSERARLMELMIHTEKMNSLGGLAAGMAHEINNPLGIIQQASQNLERRLTIDLPANGKVAQEIGLDLNLLHAFCRERQIPAFVSSIQEAVGRATRIVGNMLRFSRRPNAAHTPASLQEVVQHALELAASEYDLRKRYDFKRIQILRRDEPELPDIPMVPEEVEQVVLNLVKNAAQAMMENPPDRPPCLYISIRREPPHLVLEIEDNGPGMSESVRRRVFEPFFTTKDPGAGTGLGLSVSYMIITQSHKGQLEVESAPGQGARFTVRLPMHPGGDRA